MDEFSESELGTKAYWDNYYERELNNNDSIVTNGDEGGDDDEYESGWFGKAAELKIVKYIQNKSSNGNSSNSSIKSAVIDLGCGNGHLLKLLSKSVSLLCGFDYSEKAVKLCQEKYKNISNITFGVVDVLKDKPKEDSVECDALFLVDKGTFDAISLIPESELLSYSDQTTNTQTQTHETRETRLKVFDSFIFRQYKRFLHSLKENNPKTKSIEFILTSCNFTKEELIQIFTPEFKLQSEISHPSYIFGGKTGNTVTTLIFSL